MVNLNPLYTKDELKYLFQDSAVLPYYLGRRGSMVRPLCEELNVSTVFVTKLSDFMPNATVSTPEG